MAKAKTKTKKPSTKKPVTKKPAAKPAASSKKKAGAKQPVLEAKTVAPKSTQVPKKPTTVPLSSGDVLAVSEAVPFHLEVMGLDGRVTVYTTNTGDLEVSPPEWMAVVPVTPCARRYLFLIQIYDDHKFAMLPMIDGAGAPRLPAAGGWVRPIVVGRLHLIGSDRLLSRRDIAGIIGGHTGKPGDTQPPNI